MAKKRTNIGGQAVIEGVMMRGKKMYALAVRHLEKKTIDVRKFDLKPAEEKLALFKLPIFRGMAAFVESLVLGMKTITLSMEMAGFDEFEEEPSAFEKKLTEMFGEKLNDIIIWISVILAIALSVGLFMVLPVLVAGVFKRYLANGLLLSAAEGIIRVLIFIAYLILIARMKDIQRVFQYHGAEHKTINCFEAGVELIPENVRGYTRIHKRCGTSFLFLVMIISMLIFMFLPTREAIPRILSRIALVPFIAGISYEVIRWAGRSDNALVAAVSYPGMCLQYITTSEPDDGQLEVAIAAMKMVLEHEPEGAGESVIAAAEAAVLKNET